MEENREIEIDLRKLFSMLKKKIVYIILISFIGALLAGCFTNFFIDSKYTANVKLYVNSNNNSVVSSSGTISSGEYDASEKLVNTYVYIVKSTTFLEKVADALGDNYTASQISSMITCSTIEDTLAFQVSVTSKDPQEAMDVANAIAQTCPEEIINIVKVGSVEVIDYAKLPQSPSYPNLQKNIFIGLIIGFVISFAFFLIKELFNTVITNEADVQKEFDIPILGTVPRIIPTTTKSNENNVTGSPASGSTTLMNKKENK